MNGTNMVFKEKHRRNDDIGTRYVRFGAFENSGIAVPVRCRVKTDADIIARHVMIGTLDRSGQVVVEGDYHHTY